MGMRACRCSGSYRRLPLHDRPTSRLLALPRLAPLPTTLCVVDRALYTGHCDVTILGSMQVAANADMANYLIPGKLVKGMGGAMDLVSSPARVVVMMEHCDKKGNPKILPQCTLPITGHRVVSLLVTEHAVFDFKPDGAGMRLLEIAPGTGLEDLRAMTAADFEVVDGLKEMA